MKNNREMTQKQMQREENFRRLQAVSATAKKLKDAMCNNAATDAEIVALESRPLNWFILKLYRKENPEATDFRTFMEWKASGYSVKKGMKGFPVWSTPKRSETKITRERQDGTTEEETVYGHENFHMAYLFSDMQVEETKQKN